MTDLSTPEEERPLAGEYVLGVLDATERAQAQARIAAEPSFARAVQWWENHLTPLATDIKGVEPSAGLWPRIANLIGEATKPSLWNNTRVWRGVSVGAIALAAASVAALVMTPSAPPVPAVAPTPAAAEVALINDPASNKPALVATLDHATDKLILTPLAMEMPDGREPELWIIPEGQKAISLGMIPKNAPIQIALPAGLRGGGTYTATLAITDEPPGGAPTGVATGSVRAIGKFVKA
ncbi:anti-sigma factor [Caulobacter sp. ErkDOM-YI]|uniref:anti-sigma factor n=1 Tax=unclassified Caulobacter TaxID=2648921 RepID=UPI003AF9FF4C